MTRTAVLMSIKPKYSELILSGKKTVELRRVCPRLEAGDLVMIYASRPRMALVGGFEVAGIVSGKPDSIFEKHGKSTGVSREVFDAYFAGSDIAYGIKIARVWSLREETELKTLRKRVKGFHPPQSYRYLRGKEWASLSATDLQ
jgi:predicted transcriptional regulator